jgi:hypothetical protein
MYLKYGSYTHPLGEPGWVITNEAVESDSGDIFAVRTRWEISGLISNQGGTAANMKTKIAALEAAYASDNQDATIYLPDGVTESNHKIVAANTIGGTKIVRRPSYPQSSGPEGVTMRHFQLAIEALIPLTSEQVILAFEESVNFQGGGPRYVMLETLTGPPIKQLGKQATIYQAVQEGRAVGLYGYPVVPRPLWPTALMGNPRIRRRSPRRVRSNYTEYEVSWSYEFASAVRMIGSPHLATV